MPRAKVSAKGNISELTVISVRFRSELLLKTAYYPIFVFDFYERANMARTVSEEKFATILDVFRQTRDALLGDPLTPPGLKKLRIDL